MQPEHAEILNAVQQGQLSPADAWQQLQSLIVTAAAKSPTSPTAGSVEVTTDAVVDIDRAARCGFPEVVYAPGKSAESLVEIVGRLLTHQQAVLATRVSVEQAEVVTAAFPDLQWNPIARTLRSPTDENQPRFGRVPVISAGTTDRPVAEEAWETLRWAGCESEVLFDIGVAGPQRLQQALPRLHGAAAVVVAAGMEGALPSVVGGYLDCPVIAVPTSVGYGTGQGGFAALLGMLNSCAANVTVVNIDAGFKAGYIAALISRGIARARQ